MLRDRFSYSYFAFNRRSENQAQVTSRASLGKPIVSIEVERRSFSKPFHFIIYGGRQLISMQEIQIGMQEIQISTREIQRKSKMGLIFQHSILL